MPRQGAFEETSPEAMAIIIPIRKNITANLGCLIPFVKNKAMKWYCITRYF